VPLSFSILLQGSVSGPAGETAVGASVSKAVLGRESPYGDSRVGASKLGVVEVGALADLLLVDGNPIENIKLVADPAKNFVVIMKDGKVYKNTLSKER
jgi:hypothetical protein